mmetsp:Transcript_70339/g.161381  ORF Transcript_70339/g.161381 Transcript_70339/m.161381 type:complete len:216 (+) Transcript_70339:346-993(+)
MDGCSLEVNMARAAPALHRFSRGIGTNEAADAFVVELRGAELCGDLERFAAAVHRALCQLSQLDPSQSPCMTPGRLSQRSWCFSFCRETFFVTTFAPFYPPDHPRHQFGAAADSGFILLQPEMSFLVHGVSEDIPRGATNWDDPQTERDRIRSNFWRAGREFYYPETVKFPPALMVVAALDPFQDPFVEFWKPPPWASARTGALAPASRRPVSGR